MAEPIKILLVEDNPGDTRLIRKMLSQENSLPHHIESMETLSEGLERLEDGNINVILFRISLLTLPDRWRK